MCVLGYGEPNQSQNSYHTVSFVSDSITTGLLLLTSNIGQMIIMISDNEQAVQ